MHPSALLSSEFSNLIIILSFLSFFYRNQSYHTRVQLAVLDHNAHLNRQIAQNKQGELMHSRKFRKQTKKWDTTPTLTKKKYEYIPMLIDSVVSQRSNTSSRLKDKVVLHEDHPKRRQSTIANSEPASTSELVANKRSRFNNS